MNMEIKEPELSNAIQDASQRIYNEMLKNTDNFNTNEPVNHDRKIDNVEAIAGTSPLPNGHRYLRDRRLPEPRIEIHLSDLSDCSSFLEEKNQNPLNLMHSHVNEKNKLNPKNAICNQDLSEGEAVASKLNDHRLIKGISKSVGNNLNSQHQRLLGEENSASNFQIQNYFPHGEITTSSSHQINGIFALNLNLAYQNLNLLA